MFSKSTFVFSVYADDACGFRLIVCITYGNDIIIGLIELTQKPLSFFFLLIYLIFNWGSIILSWQG